jgi:DNA-binding MarR family transcriptional regulator
MTDSVAAWRALLLAHNRAVRAIEADLAATEAIPLGWYDVLLELQAEPDGLRMQDLGDRAVLSRTRVSRLVDELEARGLVSRRPDPNDGRAMIAAITPSGREVFRSTAPLYLARIDEHFGRHLTARELEVVARALTKVVDAHTRLTLPTSRASGSSG